MTPASSLRVISFHLRRRGVLFLVALAAGSGILIWRAEIALSRLVLGGPGQSHASRVFAAPIAVGADAPRDPARLLLRLRRLGYREVPRPAAAGQYSWRRPVLTVHLRGFSAPLPAQPPGLFTVDFVPGGAAKVRRASGAEVPRLWLEPELAAELSGAKKLRRERAAAGELPPSLLAAAAADSQGFSGSYEAWRRLAQGLFPDLRRTPGQALLEAAFSVYVAARLGKEGGLAAYLDRAYMGQDGTEAVFGAKAAAGFYFGKSLDRLSLGQCALLAAISRSPYRCNPRRDPDEARKRRDLVLSRMAEAGSISQAELGRARAEAMDVLSRPSGEPRVASYFAAEAVRQALPRYGEEALFCRGLDLHTTMDPLLQEAAQAAVLGLPSQAALVALAPEDGRVLALVGGRDFKESQYGRATRSRRQPGSAFKPFLFGAALERGYTAASSLEDRPKAFPSPPGEPPWQPRNYEGICLGTATLRSALAHSLNAASLDLAGRIGPAAVAAFARRLGIKSPLEESLALALGKSEVSLMELTAAYAAFANGGFRVEPRLIASVYDAAGKRLESAPAGRLSVLAPARAYLLTALLQSVVKEGTAKELGHLGFRRPCAGKTGTTNEGRDAWFVGYTPSLLAGVWVGGDGNEALSLTGAKDALPVWAAFMRQAAEGPAADFVRPQGLVSVDIDPGSGLRAGPGCPERRAEVFLTGTAPTAGCPLHRWAWLKKWFGHRARTGAGRSRRTLG